MTRYREILRLSSLGFSARNISTSTGCSRNTVARVVKRAAERSLSWPLPENLTDAKLESMLYPKQTSASTKRMPDFGYIQKELLRNGISKKLLWTEYLEECRQTGDESLMYSQFCYYIQKDEEKRRTSMHIPRKPAEQIEVDWAAILHISLTRIPEKLHKHMYSLVSCRTVSMPMQKPLLMRNRLPGLPYMFICISTSVVLQRFWCRTTEKLL